MALFLFLSNIYGNILCAFQTITNKIALFYAQKNSNNSKHPNLIQKSLLAE